MENNNRGKKEMRNIKMRPKKGQLLVTIDLDKGLASPELTGKGNYSIASTLGNVALEHEAYKGIKVGINVYASKELYEKEFKPKYAPKEDVKEMAEKDAQIKEKDALIAEKDKQIAEMMALLEKNNQMMAKLIQNKK